MYSFRWSHKMLFHTKCLIVDINSYLYYPAYQIGSTLLNILFKVLAHHMYFPYLVLSTFKLRNYFIKYLTHLKIFYSRLMKRCCKVYYTIYYISVCFLKLYVLFWRKRKTKRLFKIVCLLNGNFCYCSLCFSVGFEFVG